MVRANVPFGNSSEPDAGSVGHESVQREKVLASGLADCDISGMSTASVAAAGSLKYCVSGMSEFNYSGEPVVISTSVDNATVRHR